MMPPSENTFGKRYKDAALGLALISVTVSCGNGLNPVYSRKKLKATFQGFFSVGEGNERS
jgi:hypothetical protein